jgi:hypothetical protein
MFHPVDEEARFTEEACTQLSIEGRGAQNALRMVSDSDGECWRYKKARGQSKSR